jgi:hypothetical protein
MSNYQNSIEENDFAQQIQELAESTPVKLNMTMKAFSPVPLEN